ncbi:MAG: Glyoxalase/bleomycin resistance protein/dioxygenase [Verrucomicrobiales bacterium]|nr:Glyoxalase/bleomycin resistance protein/dioxygenase [Verrucomicrobiales bacterium]
MSIPVKPIPEGFHSITPYLSIRGAAEAIEFYKRAFDAKERYRMPGPDGKTIGHAELLFGNSIVMLADAFPQCGNVSPSTLNGTTVGLAFYVEDVDSQFKKAIDAGAKVERPLEDMFYGDRSATVVDPYGHKWSIMTHKEDVSAEEIQKRLAGEYAKMGSEPGKK